ASWSCVSWTGVVGFGMGTSFEVQDPYPPYSMATAVSNSAFHYGYTGGQVQFPTAPAFLSHPTIHGLAATCLTIGSGRRPDGHVCIDREGLVISYQFPAQASGSTPYLSLTLRSWRASPPADAFRFPATPKRASGT
ncbi:MAG: hypothetical protein ACYCUG_18120, partial [Acidimicrobiales bacterium]